MRIDCRDSVSTDRSGAHSGPIAAEVPMSIENFICKTVNRLAAINIAPMNKVRGNIGVVLNNHNLLSIVL